MAQSKIVPVVYSNDSGDPSTDALLHLLVFDNKESLLRAVKRLGLFWLLALVSVPVIFAHWVLVPGFFIAGPIAAVRVYKSKEMLEKSSGSCPHCREAIEVKMEAKEALPKWTYCPKCKQSLHIHR